MKGGYRRDSTPVITPVNMTSAQFEIEKNHRLGRPTVVICFIKLLHKNHLAGKPTVAKNEHATEGDLLVADWYNVESCAGCIPQFRCLEASTSVATSMHHEKNYCSEASTSLAINNTHVLAAQTRCAALVAALASALCPSWIWL